MQDKRLLARYRKREEARGKERELNPLALLHGDSVSYLVCSFGNYTDVWHLPLHRFSSARLLEKPATRPAGFDLEKYLSEEQALQYPWTPCSTPRPRPTCARPDSVRARRYAIVPTGGCG